MLITTDETAKTITITFNDVQYAIARQTLVVKGEFERLLLNHLQMVQDRQHQRQKDALQTFIEQATPDQKIQVLDSIASLNAPAGLSVAKGV